MRAPSKRPLSELPSASLSKRVQVQNLLYENEFDLHLNGLVSKPHFHMKGFTLGLVLKQRQREQWGGGTGGAGGRGPGVMGAGGLREAGEEGAGGEISKRGRSREKWGIFRNIGTIFRNRKSTRRREPPWKGAGTGSVGCGRRDVQTPLSPPPRTRKGPINATYRGTVTGFCCFVVFIGRS